MKIKLSKEIFEQILKEEIEKFVQEMTDVHVSDDNLMGNHKGVKVHEDDKDKQEVVDED